MTMALPQSLPGLAGTPIPFVARQYIPGAGTGLSVGNQFAICITGNMLAGGTETVEKVGGFIRDDNDCFTRFNRRSEVTWQYRAIRAVDQQVPIRIVAVAENGSATASTRTYTFAGAAAVATTLYLYTCKANIPNMRNPMPITIGAGDSPTTQVNSVVAAVNNDPDLPFSAALGAAVPGVGSETSNANTFPVALVNGDTLLGKVDEQVSATTLTIAAVAATVTGSAATYAAVTATHGIVLSFEGVQYPITFAGTENTQALFHARINSSLPGSTAGGLAVNAGGQTKLVTNQLGSGAIGAVVSGDADVLASLGLAIGAFTPGTGNVPNVAVVTAAQFAALLTATFTGGTAGSTGTANANNSVTWATNTAGLSPKGVQFTSGTIVAKIPGFDTAEHNGAASTTAQLILTTYNKGPRSAQWLAQVRALYLDTTVGTTITAGSNTPGSGPDDWTNALQALSPQSIVHTFHAPACTAVSAVNVSDGGLGAYAFAITDGLSPTKGKDQTLVYAISGTSSQAVAVAQSSVINSAFMKGPYALNNDWPSSMWAAHYAGILRSQQIIYAAFNFRDYQTDANKGTVCLFPPPADSGSIPLTIDEVTALNGGVAVVTWDGGVNARIVRDISSRSWTGSVQTLDFTAREGHIGITLIVFWQNFFALIYKRRQGNVLAKPAQGVKRLPGVTYTDSVEATASALVLNMTKGFQNGMPLLNPDNLQPMLKTVRCTLVPGGWFLKVHLQVIPHDLFDSTQIYEDSPPY